MNSNFYILIEYIPIYILGIISGLAGYLYHSTEFKWYLAVKQSFSSGVLAIIGLMLIEEFFDFSLKGSYAIVLLGIFFSPDRLLELLDKWKTLK